MESVTLPGGVLPEEAAGELWDEIHHLLQATEGVRGVVVLEGPGGVVVLEGPGALVVGEHLHAALERLHTMETILYVTHAQPLLVPTPLPLEEPTLLPIDLAWDLPQPTIIKRRKKQVPHDVQVALRERAAARRDQKRLRHLVRAGHTPHCAARKVYGDGECECRKE